MFCLSTTPKLNNWCTPLKPSSSSRLYQLSWWETSHLKSKNTRYPKNNAPPFLLLVDLSPPAGVEWQFFSGDGPSGSQRSAERTEEKQRHQQLQRQPQLEPGRGATSLYHISAAWWLGFPPTMLPKYLGTSESPDSSHYDTLAVVRLVPPLMSFETWEET